MKKISLYAFAIGMASWAGAALTACQTLDAPFDADAVQGFAPVIELTFDTGMATRAEGPLLTKEEQMLKTVDLFFYPSGSGETAVPVKTLHIDNTQHKSQHTVSLSTSPAPGETQSEFQKLFGHDEYTDGGNCIVFAVANVSEKDFADSGVTKASARPEQLKQIVAHTGSFAKVFYDEKKPQEFEGIAMLTKAPAGDAITYSLAARKASGEIKLKNLAAKIDLVVNFGTDIEGVDPNGTIEGTTWNVATSSDIPTAEVHILNGVTAVTLDGSIPWVPREESSLQALAEENYYSIRVGDNDTYIRRMDPRGQEEGWYITDKWFYTYPNEWTNSPLEQHRTSLLLKVDWTTLDDPEQADDNDLLTTYYNVPLALDDLKLESNRYYRIKVHINTLGGQSFGEPLDLEDITVEVLDWGEAELEADIRELRYLEVSQKQKDRDGQEYTAVINGNECLVTIPFRSSHKAIINSVKIEYTDYNSIVTEGSSRNLKVLSAGIHNSADLNAGVFTKTQEELFNNTWQCAYIDNLNHTITVKHNIGVTALNSSQNNYYPDKGNNNKNTYYSYLITIVLKHEGSNETFGGLETITIMHHPPIYIEGEVNTSINETDWYSATNLRANPEWDREYTAIPARWYHYGFVRVNSDTRKTNNYGAIKGIVKNSANPVNRRKSADNPVMYIISVTQLEEGSKFHIRDPRVTQNMAGTIGGSWQGAPHWQNGAFVAADGTNYKLQNYFPTDDSQVDEVRYALSPRFRVCSGFGINANEISVADAKRRCASYCEFGYPAGRWRLPTLGEMEFLMQLSINEVVPPLFKSDDYTDFICAQGFYTFDDYGNPTKKDLSDGYVRCVYDDWYWVKADGTPDKIDDPYNARSDHQIFVWGDKDKNNPQVQPESND